MICDVAIWGSTCKDPEEYKPLCLLCRNVNDWR